MRSMLASWRVETLRLRRSNLLLGLIVVFAFFGLAGPGLALYMPELLATAGGTDQLTIEAAPATPYDGIALFTQSAMQLGLILAVALAASSLGWDARAGSSIFYRTRARSLAVVTVPRLAADWAAAVLSYVIGLVLAAVLTAFTIGSLPLSTVVNVGVNSVAYLVMAMSIGYLAMAVLRRSAAAIAVSAVLVLMLPLLSQFSGIAGWVPTALLTATEISALPLSSALAVTIGCVVAASAVAARHSLRRDG
jgi:ABC-2 type transport system permease protein